MRPGLKAREGELERLAPLLFRPASMRPGLKAREGLGSETSNCFVSIRASMRPGLKAREGCIVCIVFNVNVNVLQ